MLAQIVIDWAALLAGIGFLVLVTLVSLAAPRKLDRAPPQSADRFIPGNWTPKDGFGDDG